MWGPQKIPELARALGRAKKEFDSASKEISATVASASDSARPKTGDELLVDTAESLGISTAGKTREQISQEIVAKSRK
ncbi:MAG: twin-arginine translocase TatA/TatE family subunit [archaeon]|nr:MAG: twin-arginine translocase TatA/TatE family subunit [archaeon]